MKVKRNSKKVNVSEVSLQQLFEMFEGGEESNLDGFDEFEGEDGADEGVEGDAEGEDFGDDDMGDDMGDEDFGDEAGETVTVEIDPNGSLADALHAILDVLEGGADEGDDFGDDMGEEGDDLDGEEPADEGDDDFEPSDEGDDDFEPEEDEESPATVTNGAPRKTVGTPEWEGKNKKTVKTNLRTLTGTGNAATVTNGAPRKNVNTPEWQGKNKKTVDSNLNPDAQMFQI